MNNLFFTADLHLSHKNCIKYCQRPFESVKQMNETLINNWNERITNKDDVYFLGDFCLAPLSVAQMFFDSLKGRKYLVKGNHDKVSVKIQGWKWIKDIYELNYNKQLIVLCHYSMQSWRHSCRDSWHLFGHSHGTLKGIGKSLDVGVDCWNYKPVSFEEIKEKLNKSKEIKSKLIPNNQLNSSYISFPNSFFKELNKDK